MSKRKTKYNKSWESQFNWIKSCSKGVHSVHCNLCQKDISTSGGGVTQIKSHTTSKLHLAREKEREGQSHFSKDADNSIHINNTEISLSTEEEIRNAEIIQALKCVESNYSFAYTSNDGERFRTMFPDHRLLNTSSKVKRKQNTQCNTAFINTSKILCWKI